MQRLIAQLTDHVKATGVTEELHVVRLDFDVVVGEDAVGSIEEANQLGVGVQLFYHIEKTHDHIVSTSGLSSGENASDL
jgi:hypothetical protein